MDVPLPRNRTIVDAACEILSRNDLFCVWSLGHILLSGAVQSNKAPINFVFVLCRLCVCHAGVVTATVVITHCFQINVNLTLFGGTASLSRLQHVPKGSNHYFFFYNVDCLLTQYASVGKAHGN